VVFPGTHRRQGEVGSSPPFFTPNPRGNVRRSIYAAFAVLALVLVAIPADARTDHPPGADAVQAETVAPVLFALVSHDGTVAHLGVLVATESGVKTFLYPLRAVQDDRGLVRDPRPGDPSTTFRERDSRTAHPGTTHTRGLTILGSPE
jgi:hypothetical protein